MKLDINNFASAKYDVFSMFNNQWALCTAGTPAEYNTMTIGWGTMGTIWGPPMKGKQIITVFLRESRRTSDILLEGERFTVCFFPDEKRQDLGYLGMHSGHNEPDKISKTTLTPKMLDNSVGFEEATLTFVCKKLYTHLMGKEELPEFVRDTLYRDGDLHYIFMGEIEDVFGTIDE